MFKLIIVIFALVDGRIVPQAAEHQETFATLSECMEASAPIVELAEQEPSVRGFQVNCVRNDEGRDA